MAKNFGKGEVLFHEGDNGDSFFEIVKGEVGCYTDYGEPTQHELSKIGSGHIVGEMALIDAFPRSATVVALEDTEAEEVTVDGVREYFKNNPEKITFIIDELGGRLTRLTKEYDEACETIRSLFPSEPRDNDSFVEKIKKFANYYRNLDKKTRPSEEYLREVEGDAHGEGYSKKVESFDEDAIIFREGEKGRCMYDIHFGSVGIYTGYGTDDERLLATLTADKFFGEIGLLTGEPRTATAVVLEGGTLIETIYAEDFTELFEKNPAKIEMIIKHLSSRIRRLTYEYVNACQLIYDAAEAELKNSVSAELRQRAENFTRKY